MKKRKWTRDEIFAYKKEKGQSQVFYYNKEDSNIFILRESGLGFSPNWANPWSWVIIVCIIIIIVVFVLFRKHII
jgi:uncharacterized membrane protein